MMCSATHGPNMRRYVRWLLRVLVLLPLWVGGANVAAARRALLIGVSELPGQPAVNWLQAPRNDVQLMQRALFAQGWQPDTVQALADGVPGAGLPDVGTIHAALDRLVAQTAPGDFVLLYFSGHGTRVHDFGKQYREPDGLAEMFLARQGALHDVEIGRWVQALLARGAFVWSVFDTCSATSMTRGGASAGQSLAFADDEADPVRFRGLASAQLTAATRKAALASNETDAGASDDAPFAPPARYVAFFAAESHQTTPELRLPRGQPGAEVHGLLTWAIAEALRQQPATWRALFNDVLALYPPVIDELQQRFPTRELPSPVAEGTLDAPLFENAADVVSTQPVWPARRQQSGLVLSAGLLDGAQPNQTVRLSAVLPDGRIQDAAATISMAHLSTARVALPPSWTALPAGTSWRVTPARAPADVALRVQAGSDAARNAFTGMSLSYPASISMVSAPTPADVVVTAQGSAFVATATGSGVGRTLPDARALRRHVTDLAMGRWLNRLMQLARDERSVPIKGFEARLWSRPVGSAEGRVDPLTARIALPGGGAAVEIENSSGSSVDLMIIGMTADGVVVPIFPVAPGETNRFERGDALAPARKRFVLPHQLTAAGSALIVLATPARPRSPPRLYGISPPRVDELPSSVRGAMDSDGPDSIYAVMARW